MYAWHKHFNVGHKSVDNDLCSGHPSMPTTEASVQHVTEIMRCDRKKSVDQTASEVGISVGSCHSILHDVLNMSRICQHSVPQMLTPQRKGIQMSISDDLIHTADEDNKIIAT